MDLKLRYYPESYFGGYKDIDGTEVFYLRVNILVPPYFTGLGFGCDREAHSEDSVKYRRELQTLK